MYALTKGSYARRLDRSCAACWHEPDSAGTLHCGLSGMYQAGSRRFHAAMTLCSCWIAWSCGSPHHVARQMPRLAWCWRGGCAWQGAGGMQSPFTKMYRYHRHWRVRRSTTIRSPAARMRPPSGSTGTINRAIGWRSLSLSIRARFVD